MSLTLYEGAGLHNADIVKSAGRVIQGGGWKKQRIVAVIPAGPTVPTKVMLAMRNLIFPPNQPCVWIAAEGMEVGEAYSKAIEAVLAHPELSQWEYLLTVEHDNLPPADGVLKLLERMEANPNLACVGGLYWTKGYGGQPQIWGDDADAIVNYRPQPPDPNGGLVKCCGTGMGFNLWRLKMFKDPKLRRPWFKTIAGKDGTATQDLYAWADFRAHGYKCAVDCSVKVGHYDHEGKFGPAGTTW